MLHFNDENGTKKYATDIQGDSMTMLGNKRDTQNDQHLETEKKLDVNQSNAADNPATSQDNTNQESKNLPF